MTLSTQLIRAHVQLVPMPSRLPCCIATGPPTRRVHLHLKSRALREESCFQQPVHHSTCACTPPKCRLWTQTLACILLLAPEVRGRPAGAHLPRPSNRMSSSRCEGSCARLTPCAYRAEKASRRLKLLTSPVSQSYLQGRQSRRQERCRQRPQRQFPEYQRVKAEEAAACEHRVPTGTAVHGHPWLWRAIAWQTADSRSWHHVAALQLHIGSRAAVAVRALRQSC